MRSWPVLLPVTLTASASFAHDVTFKPLAEARIRYENVDQDGLPEDADALTARLRAGGQAKSGPWSALIEGEALVAIVDRYNDGLNGKARYPLVVDPENIELNRAQLRFDRSGAAATAGRQRLELLDQRFVGSSGFRQNEQTHDAVRVQLGKPDGVTADLTYSARVRTVNGSRGRGVRQTAVSGDNLFALIGYATPVGTLTGFAYLVDQDEAAVQGFRLSSQTYGVRLAGVRALGGSVKLSYAASWARQSDWHRNPNDYGAHYWLGEAKLSKGALSGTVGYEVLGADRGVALTSVQTPLASLFKFQGWADKFTTTPPDGLRDAYATLAQDWKAAGPADTLALSATCHQFYSDRLSRRYGTEIDLLAAARRGRYTLSARYARYRADAFATDTDKLWLSVDWTL